MEYTFEFDVDAAAAEVNVGGASCGAELTEEQFGRAKASWETGRYTWLDEDASIRDIFDIAHRAALDWMAEDEEFGAPELVPARIGYPLEATNTPREYPSARWAAL